MGDRYAHVMAPTPVPLSHQISIIQHKFKDKIIKNFKMVTEEHQTNAGALHCL